MGGCVCDVRVDLGSLVSLKFLFGLAIKTNVLVFHWFTASCRSQPCRFSKTKTLPTPSLPCFYSHRQLSQTGPALAIKTDAI